MTGSMTVRELKTEGELALKAAGIGSAANDALELLLYVLKTDLTGYAGRLEQECGEADILSYRECIRLRASHKPLQYITGEAPFFGRMFCVTEDVLIPRFDSETMAAEAVRALPEGGRVLDLCCGSGCLLLTVLAERPDACGTGTDISEAALRVSKTNAERLALSDRADFRQGDLFAALSPEDTFDVIISNPPYIADPVIETLDPEVRGHEPRLALSGGPDGLAFYRRIVPEALPHLKAEGILFLEVGSDEADAVLSMMRGFGYENTGILPDLAGNPRTVRGSKQLRHPEA